MDKWDKKEGDIGDFIPVIKDYLKSQSVKDDKPPLIHLNMSVTKEEMKKISEALNS